MQAEDNVSCHADDLAVSNADSLKVTLFNTSMTQL